MDALYRAVSPSRTTLTDVNSLDTLLEETMMYMHVNYSGLSQ